MKYLQLNGNSDSDSTKGLIYQILFNSVMFYGICGLNLLLCLIVLIKTSRDKKLVLRQGHTYQQQVPKMEGTMIILIIIQIIITAIFLLLSILQFQFPPGSIYILFVHLITWLVLFATVVYHLHQFRTMTRLLKSVMIINLCFFTFLTFMIVGSALDDKEPHRIPEIGYYTFIIEIIIIIESFVSFLMPRPVIIKLQSN